MQRVTPVLWPIWCQREVRAETLPTKEWKRLLIERCPKGDRLDQETSSQGDLRGETAKSLHACKAALKREQGMRIRPYLVLPLQRAARVCRQLHTQVYDHPEIISDRIRLIAIKDPRNGVFYVHNHQKHDNGFTIPPWYSVYIRRKGG